MCACWFGGGPRTRSLYGLISGRPWVITLMRALWSYGVLRRRILLQSEIPTELLVQFLDTCIVLEACRTYRISEKLIGEMQISHPCGRRLSRLL